MRALHTTSEKWGDERMAKLFLSRNTTKSGKQRNKTDNITNADKRAALSSFSFLCVCHNFIILHIFAYIFVMERSPSKTLPIRGLIFSPAQHPFIHLSFESESSFSRVQFYCTISLFSSFRVCMLALAHTALNEQHLCLLYMGSFNSVFSPSLSSFIKRALAGSDVIISWIHTYMSLLTFIFRICLRRELNATTYI